MNASARGNKNERKTLEAWAYHFRNNPQDLKAEARSKKSTKAVAKYSDENRSADINKSLNLTGRTSKSFASEQTERGGILSDGRGRSVLMLKPSEMRAMTAGNAGTQTNEAIFNGNAPLYTDNLNVTSLFPISAYFDASNYGEVVIPELLGLAEGAELNELDAINSTSISVNSNITVAPQRIAQQMEYSKMLTLQSADLQDEFFTDRLLKGIQTKADSYVTSICEATSSTQDATGIAVSEVLAELVDSAYHVMPTVHVSPDVLRKFMTAAPELYKAVQAEGVKFIRNTHLSAGSMFAFEGDAVFTAAWGDNVKVIMDPYTGAGQDTRKVTATVDLGAALIGENILYNNIGA